MDMPQQDRKSHNGNGDRTERHGPINIGIYCHAVLMDSISGFSVLVGVQVVRGRSANDIRPKQTMNLCSCNDID